MERIYRTGNETVDQISQMEIRGNVIPSAWYQTIRKETGKPYLNAIVILSDIVYWYRAAEVRDKESGEILGYRKRFKADILQRSYQQMAEQFGISKRDASNAIVALEKIGVVKRVFRKVRVDRFTIPNVMFLALDAEVLRKLTFPDGQSTGNSGGSKEDMEQEFDSMEDMAGEIVWREKKEDRSNDVQPENTEESGKGAYNRKGMDRESGSGGNEEKENSGDMRKENLEGGCYAKIGDTTKTGMKEMRASKLGYEQSVRPEQMGSTTCQRDITVESGGTPQICRKQRSNRIADTTGMRGTNTEITYKDYHTESLILSSHQIDRHGSGCDIRPENTVISSAYREIKEEFKRQIEYDILKHDLGDLGELDELVEVASEVLTSRAGTIRVNREERNAAEVKERYKGLTMFHVQYVLHCLSETASRIRNIRAVMITALYNASSTISTYYGNLYHRQAVGAA